MKRTFTVFIFTLFLLCGFSSQAQVDTRGTDFLVSFGMNATATTTSSVILQIRIVADEAATGTIYFSNIGVSVPFSVAAGSVYTHTLTQSERDAVYNFSTGVSNKTARIQSSVPVTVYALNTFAALADATNVLPTPVLGNDYYHLGLGPSASGRYDQYIAIATQNNTDIYENGILMATLSAGQIYFKQAASSIDMSGYRITSSNPIAYFSAHSYAVINGGGDNFFQQLTPVNTWGRNFIVPVTNREVELVRIVASQNNTVITQIGGTVMRGSLTLNAGEWVELRITLANRGCYIQADKPVQVCSYMVGTSYPSAVNTYGGDESLAWIPPIEQTITSALIAPFAVNSLTSHFVLIVTPTATKNNTTVSIGGGTPTALTGGTWYDNAASGMSFYSVRLTNYTASYVFANQAGLLAYAYGFGYYISYYYLAGSSMRVLDAAFYVDDIHYQDLAFDTICAQPAQIRAEITGDMSTNPGFLKWYMDDVEETAAQDRLTWSKNFANGTYQIKMIVLMNDDVTTKTVEGTLNSFCPTTTKEIAICQGDSVLFGDRYFKETGIYFDTLKTALNYDSIVSMDLTVNPVYRDLPVSRTICQGDSVFFAGKYYKLAGIHTDTLKTRLNCDSIVSIDLTVNPVYRDLSVSRTICQGDSIFFGRKYYKLAGIHTDTLKTKLNCDSIVSIDLTVNPIYCDLSVSRTICQGDSIFFAGKYYKLAGVHTDTLKTKLNCDSIVTLNLTVNPVYHDLPVPRSICKGDSTFFGGRYYKEEGIYYDTLKTKLNCDSIVSIDLVFNLIYRDLPVSRSICQGDSIFFGRKYYKLAGIHTDTLKAKFDCDSIVTLDLTLNPVYRDLPVSRTICQGDSIFFGRKFYKLAGTHTDTLKTKFNCDSIVTLNLTVNPVYNDLSVSRAICQGDSLFFAGKYYKLAGTHTDTLKTKLNCDSIVTLDLTVNPTYHNTPMPRTICQGDSTFFGGRYYKGAGIYYDTLKTKLNCDSIISINLTVNPVYRDLSVPRSICQGDSTFFGRRFYKSVGIHTDTLKTKLNCDSIVTLNLTVNPVYNDLPVSRSICQGDSLFFAGKYYKLAGTHTDILKTKFGCDSVVTLNLTLNPVYRDLPIPRSICRGDSTFFGGRYYKQAGTYYDTLQTKLYCDSIVSIALTINPVHTTPTFATICSGESYDFFSTTLTVGGTYYHTLKNKYSCDSTVVLNLTVGQVYNITEPHIAFVCQGTGYEFAGRIYREEGIYTETLRTRLGCDSIVTLDLTVLSRTDTLMYDTIFVNRAYEGNGFRLPVQREVGTFVETRIHVNANGCEGVARLLLTVLEECEVEPALFFTPNGDSKNDTWIINNLHCLEDSYIIRIYDRFGKKLVDYVNHYKAWDGTYLGKPMPSTDYWYIIKAPHREPKVGHFTLMRH